MPCIMCLYFLRAFRCASTYCAFTYMQLHRFVHMLDAPAKCIFIGLIVPSLRVRTIHLCRLLIQLLRVAFFTLHEACGGLWNPFRGLVASGILNSYYEMLSLFLNQHRRVVMQVLRRRCHPLDDD